MTRRFRFGSAVTALVWIAIGCGPRHPSVAAAPPLSPPGFPRSVAVLPLDNTSLSIEGPRILRVRLRRVLGGWGYETQKIGDTDEHLRSIGVTLGGQIPATSVDELHAALGTDAVLTGRVLKYQTFVAGVVNTRTVEAEVALTDLRSGRVLWHDRQIVKRVDDTAAAMTAGNSGNGKDAAAACLVFGAVGLVSGATQHDMRDEAAELAGILGRSMPPPGPPGAPDLPGAASLASLASRAPNEAPADAHPLSDPTAGEPPSWTTILPKGAR
jgi:hypothetical protein